MAYILGYFAADGCMYKNPRGSYYISFTSCDLELIQKVKKILKASNRIETYQSKQLRWKLRYTLQIGSKVVFNKFCELGFSPAKSLKLVFPAIPDNLINHFIRGYFDGDGSVYLRYRRRADRKNKIYKILNLRLISGSKSFLESLHKKLIKVGKIQGGAICPHSGAYALSYSYNDVVKLYSFMFPESGLPCLERKRVILEKGIISWDRSSVG